MNCRNCKKPILPGTHAGVCSTCWMRVVDGELTLHMGPEAKRDHLLRFVTRNPEAVRVDRVIARRDSFPEEMWPL